MSTVVVAPDSFKGSASAAEVAAALAAGWAEVRPDDRIVLAPMADGGEGTLDAFELAVPRARRHPVRVLGPDDSEVDSYWLMLPDGSAVVELAATSGIGLMPSLAPFDAHTVGFGQAISDALSAGASRLLLAIGGSSSTDGAAGALTALGARFLDRHRRDVPRGNRGLRGVVRAELDQLRALPPGGATILSDVTSPLLGPDGAAAVFGPQKGAAPGQIAELEGALRRFTSVLRDAGISTSPDTPGAGAAGGTGFGLLACGATMSPGAVTIAESLGLPQLVADADVVITGEGRYDSQSAAGKVPAFVSGLARDASVPALLAAGSLAASPDAFANAVSLTDLAGSTAAAIADARRWARVAGTRLAGAYTHG